MGLRVLGFRILGSELGAQVVNIDRLGYDIGFTGFADFELGVWVSGFGV